MRQTLSPEQHILNKEMAVPDPQHLALPIHRPWPVGNISSCCTKYIGSALSNLSTTCRNAMPVRPLRSGPLMQCRKKTRSIIAFVWDSSFVSATVYLQFSNPTKLGRCIGNEGWGGILVSGVPTGLGRYSGKSMFHLSLG